MLTALRHLPRCGRKRRLENKLQISTVSYPLSCRHLVRFPSRWPKPVSVSVQSRHIKHFPNSFIRYVPLDTFNMAPRHGLIPRSPFPLCHWARSSHVSQYRWTDASRPVSPILLPLYFGSSWRGFGRSGNGTLQRFGVCGDEQGPQG
jgi:hypothetical protein